MNAVTPLCAWLIFSIVIGGFGQTRPDFSGTWVVDPTHAAGPGGGGTMRKSGEARATFGGSGPVEYRIVQTERHLTIERTSGGKTQRFVHTLDGAENVNVNNRTTIRSTSRWDGTRLVTEGTETVTTSGGDISTKFRELRSRGANGSMLVELTRTGDFGTQTTTTAYVKK